MRILNNKAKLRFSKLKGPTMSHIAPSRLRHLQYSRGVIHDHIVHPDIRTVGTGTGPSTGMFPACPEHRRVSFLLGIQEVTTLPGIVNQQHPYPMLTGHITPSQYLHVGFHAVVLIRHRISFQQWVNDQ